MIKCTEIILTLIGKKSLVLSPMLYSFFFAYPFFITSFFAVFIYDEIDYALYCILGSDAINITVLWGICLWNTKLPFKID
jgi:Ca2+/Na+ antiporter